MIYLHFVLYHIRMVILNHSYYKTVNRLRAREYYLDDLVSREDDEPSLNKSILKNTQHEISKAHSDHYRTKSELKRKHIKFVI